MNRRRRAAYAKALDSMKGWARVDRPKDWPDQEWNGLIEKACSQKPPASESARFPLLRPLVSAAAALIVLVWAALFLLKARPEDFSARNGTRQPEIAAPAADRMRPLPETASPDSVRPVESASQRPGAFSEARNLLASAVRTPRPAGDKPAFTWISPDTCLQIVWFTNNNLKLEDRQ